MSAEQLKNAFNQIIEKGYIENDWGDIFDCNSKIDFTNETINRLVQYNNKNKEKLKGITNLIFEITSKNALNEKTLLLISHFTCFLIEQEEKNLTNSSEIKSDLNKLSELFVEYKLMIKHFIDKENLKEPSIYKHAVDILLPIIEKNKNFENIKEAGRPRNELLGMLMGFHFILAKCFNIPVSRFSAAFAIIGLDKINKAKTIESRMRSSSKRYYG